MYAASFFAPRMWPLDARALAPSPHPSLQSGGLIGEGDSYGAAVGFAHTLHALV